MDHGNNDEKRSPEQKRRRRNEPEEEDTVLSSTTGELPMEKIGEVYTSTENGLCLSTRQSEPLRQLNDVNLVRAESSNSNLGTIQASSLAADEGARVAMINETQTVSYLPPVEVEQIAPYDQREYLPLAIDEDQNWLSEYHCFVRSRMVEVVRASERDVSDRNLSKRVSFQQVGIRCRYCAHLEQDSRARRSSAFPSFIDKIYQSFSMMLREHFEQCTAVPDSVKMQFLELKGKISMGAANATDYWKYSASKLGMVDSTKGIVMNERTQAAAARKPAYGFTPGEALSIGPPILLVRDEDAAHISTYLYNLFSQAQRVHLLPSERKGRRKRFRIGLPGFGCKYCFQAGRLGLSRIFPARRHFLEDKANDFYDHIRRCPLCPQAVKDGLELQKQEQPPTPSDKEKAFYNRIWRRLGHEERNANA